MNLSEEEIASLKISITTLKVEHHDLDVVIDKLATDPTIDQLQIKRLKKRRLQIKDQIERLESKLIPNLNA